MAVFNEPNQWEHPLGNNADTSTLPDDAAATAGIASLQKLFQIINATPLEAGGIAPDREDVNALFKYLGDSIFYAMNGGVPSYNADYDYIAGRVVLYNDNIYKCIQANGVSSTVVAPDSVSPLGSDYWVQVATLADFANFANTDLSNLSVTGQAIINGKADTDLSNVPNSKGILVESYVNGTSWYRVYSDGWCEQGGSNVSGRITLLKAFANTNYIVIARMLFGGGDVSWDEYGGNTNKTTTTFTVGKTPVNWYACGFIR